MTQGGEPLDPWNIQETLAALDGATVEQIAVAPNICGGIMADAASIIRALLDKRKPDNK